MIARRRDVAPLLVFLAAAVYFFVGATQRDLWTTGEHRYAEVARVLTAAGRDHLVPHLNGEVYPDKPPLFFWLAGAGHRLLGMDLPLSAKLPSILGGAFTVMLTFLLGRRWYGTAAGLAAAGVLATTDLFDWASRFAHLDAFLTTVITSAIYCYVRADETPREERAARRLWTALGFLAVGAGILVKGPPAPLIPGCTILAFLLWTAPRELATRRLAWGAALAVLPGAVWAYAASRDAGWGYLDNLIRGHAIGHAVGEIDKLEPWYYYAWNVPLHLMPWTLLLPAALVAVFTHARPAERRRDRFLVAWLFASWVVFSFSKAKRDLYMIPLHPAAALLVARLFRDAAEDPARLAEPLTRWAARLVAVAAAGAGSLVALAAALVAFRADRAILSALAASEASRLAVWREKADSLVASFGTARLVFAAALALVLAGAGISALRGRTAARIGTALVTALLAWHVLEAGVTWPARDPEESPREFLESVRERIGDAPLARVGGDGGLQYAVNWTLRRDRVQEIWKTERDQLDAAETRRRAETFLAADAPRYLVTDQSQAKKLGRIGGATEILVAARRRGPALVLLGNAAATR